MLITGLSLENAVIRKMKKLVRVKLWRIKDEKIKENVKDIINEVAKECWKKCSENFMKVAKKIRRISSGAQKVIWWWNDEVKTAIKQKFEVKNKKTL